jgi:DNA-binding transcriptional MerR regulator
MRSRWKWSAEDLLRLGELLARGWTDGKIGESLGRSAVAVQTARKRNHIRPRLRLLLSARAVASKLGMSCSKPVGSWIRAGYLRGRRGQGAGRHRMWYVSEDALLRFLEDDQHWHLWDPSRLDASLKSWATEMRSDVRFLSTGEAGQRLGVTHAAVSHWINRGLLPAVRRGNWLVRESDLRGFVLPCMRSKRGKRPRRFSAQEDAQLLSLRREGKGLAAVAACLRRPLGSCAGRLARLEARSA